jgi:hypothetical protein
MWRVHPERVFILALVLVLVLAWAASTYLAPPRQRAQQQAQQQQQQQQGVQDGAAVTSWQGVCPQYSGPVKLTVYKGMSLAGADCSTGQPSLRIGADRDKSGDERHASVVFPLGGRYEKVSFSLGQPTDMGDLTGYAYGTALAVTVDGETVLARKITKDSLIAMDTPVTIDLAGRGQMVLELTTFGRERVGYTEDRYGPFMPVLLRELNFIEKE